MVWYVELPIRLADFGVLHRNEASEALSGLTHTRRFQQVFFFAFELSSCFNGVLVLYFAEKIILMRL